MKNIFNIMSAASFAGVAFLIGMTVYATQLDKHVLMRTESTLKVS